MKAFAKEIASKLDVSAISPDVLSLLRCSFLPDLFKGIQNRHLREHIKDHIPDGTQYTIFIVLYSDEVEICNPLGAKRGVHKLLAVYFTLLNLHAKHRSQLRFIHLVLLAKYDDVQTYGLEKVLSPLIEDINELGMCGVRFIDRGEVQNAQVFVFCVCGDNLSMNRLGGFTCCFSQGRVCRFCMASSKRLPELTTEDFCTLRTAQAHEGHLQAVALNPKANKKLYGVNERSPMLEVPYFDVTRQLPPDLMHDILEGGFECVLRPVL
ncbi:unnamed protein product, partial [Ixodes hexagonus]